MDEENMDEADAFEIPQDGDGAAVDAKDKTKKLIVLGALSIFVLVIAGASLMTMLGGGDEFAPIPAQGQQAPMPAVNNQLTSPAGNQPAGGMPASPPEALQAEDPFAEFNSLPPKPPTGEVSEVEFEVVSEPPAAPSDAPPLSKPEKTVDPVMDFDADLPAPNAEAINGKVDEAIKPDKPQASSLPAANGFCMGKDEVAKLLDERLIKVTDAMVALQDEVARLQASIAKNSAASLPLVAVSSQVPPAPAPKKAQPQEAAENSRYFRVVGAMPGVAWLAVKGGDPVRLVEGDVLKGFGLVENITADGRIWTDKGRVPTRIFN